MTKTETDVIFFKNINLVYFTLKKYKPEIRFDEDMLQEAKLALYKAILTYDEDKSTFANHAILSINFAVLRELKRRKRYLDNEIRLDFTAQSANMSSVYLKRLVDTKPLIEDIICENEYLSQFTTWVNNLSEKNRKIINRRLSGFKQKEIADELGISKSRVCAVLQNLKRDFTNKLQSKQNTQCYNAQTDT